MRKPFSNKMKKRKFFMASCNNPVNMYVFNV